MSDIKKIKDEYLNKLDSNLNIESLNKSNTASIVFHHLIKKKKLD